MGGPPTCTLWARTFCASMRCTGQACSCLRGCPSPRRFLRMASWCVAPPASAGMQETQSQAAWTALCGPASAALHVLGLVLLSCHRLLGVLQHIGSVTKSSFMKLFKTL